MNIFMLSTDFLPNIGGIASHIFHLSQALMRLGHRVVVVNPVEKKSFSVMHEEIEGLSVVRITYPKTNCMPLRLWCRTRFTLKVLDQLTTGLDSVILHQHDHLNSTMTSILFRRRPGVRWVWTNHTSTFLLDVESVVKQWIIAKLYRNVDGVIGVSQSRLDKALSLFRLRMPGVMIPNGVDFARFNQAVSGQRSKFSLSSDHFVVLCPSRMMPVKGVVYFAKAVNLMVERYSQIPWRFVFLGNEVNEKDVTDRAYINEIKKILRSVHEQEFVVYFGNVPPENMPDIYALADIVVLPSLMEAISLSALEAMATQRAVIASRIEGLQELIEERETGILVTPKDPEQLAHAIYTLYGNKGLRKQLAEKGEEVSKQYSWTKIAKLTADFYKRILEKQ